MPDAAPKKTRKQLARETAERSLKEAALTLLDRDGLLAGLNLQEVADEASVNRGLIHRWFGTRRELLRAAIRSQRERLAPDVLDSLERPIEQRTTWAVRQYAADPSYAKMVMLLALDGDETFDVVPYLNERLEAFRDEISAGRWARDADPLALTVLWDVILDGYFTMREALVRQTGLTRRELDTRVFTTVGRLFSAVLEPRDDVDGPPTAGTDRGSVL